ncbi:MAG TPA: glucose 1-dehydrogenase [Jatrophihabitans sp.]|nr:glucose 1-dehydrogenase [Jatrophihabitans sp.]
MTGRLDGKVAVVTGAASGIGAGTVRRFVQEGARCVLADVQDDAGQALAAEFGDAARYVHADVAVEADVASLVGAAVEQFGRLDCMFNNAGILGAVGPIAETETDAWRRTMDVLLTSVFFGIKYAARVMIPQGSGGTILNTTSTAGVRAGLGPHLYTTAKHGVVGLTQSVATELGRHRIRVNAIAPGATVSGMTAYVSTGDAAALDEASQRIARNSPLGRPGYPEDIANAALYLASDEASWVNGAVLVVDAGGEAIGDRNHRFFEMSAQTVQEAGRRTQ